MKRSGVKKQILIKNVCFATGLLVAWSSLAQVPPTLSYQGRVQVNGSAFTGFGHFKFALVRPNLALARQATATAIVNNGFITGYTITDGGAGYTRIPTVTISDPIGTGATAVASVAGGQVTDLTAVDSGKDYSPSPTVTILPPAAAFDTLWSNDGTSLQGLEPTGAVTVWVQAGLFTVMLGETSLPNMTPIPADAFASSDVRLRIWFDDGVQGSAWLTPDQRLGSAGFAFKAENVSGAVSNPTFLGTTGESPFVVSVNNQPVFRISAPAEVGGPVNLVGGSSLNYVAPGVVGATIGGGGLGYYVGSAATNSVAGDFGTVAGGARNTIESNAQSATISGGLGNTIQTGANSSTIGGGNYNSIHAYASYATIGGGFQNIIEPDNYNATIGGGRRNLIETSAVSATIGGGAGNWIMFNANYATIGGGVNNTIQTNADYAVIPGGGLNNVGTNASYAFAAGHRAKANGSGSFVWGDSQNFDVIAHNANEFVARATGGFYFITGIDGAGVPTAGVKLSPGAGSWASWSDRNSKENFQAINPTEILEKVVALPVSRWNWKSQDASQQRIGPMAQDFHAAFGLGGDDDRHITASDADGVALAAIQGLNQKVEAENARLRADIKARDAQIVTLQERLDRLERSLLRVYPPLATAH